MTDAPKPPKRRRRKIIVAFLVLVLLSMVSWWYYPRGDARFVGKWQTTATFRQSMPTAWGFKTVDLKPNGLAHLYTLSGQRLYSQWTVEGDKLVIGPEKQAKWFWELVNRIMSSITAHGYLHGQWRFSASDISGDTIRGKGYADGDVIFTRLPE
ncbi:hypothetical protein AYO47_00230 [Planctomyces sp. SCGC AG-212-M04]|nr:hypothetical protein AYO47_00230 [Planctomyces sp. SCGC AG-212-M04]